MEDVVQAQSQSGEQLAVRELVADVCAAWADNDAAAFVDRYTVDATAILPGFALRGREEIQAAMAAAFATALRGSRRIHQVQSVRFLDDATAIVISRSGTAFADEAEPAADQWSLATWALSRRTGRWLVESYHDCPATSPSDL
jgi:uncharacterized protein (TIGR02246 family)